MRMLTVMLSLAIIAAITAGTFAFYALNSAPASPHIPENLSCAADSDCVGAACCHPDSCINKEFKGVCNEFCTQICEGPLDCGAGHCGCVKGKCEVIPGYA